MGNGLFIDNMELPNMAHCVFMAKPLCPREDQEDRRPTCTEKTWGHHRHYRARTGQEDQPPAGER